MNFLLMRDSEYEDLQITRSDITHTQQSHCKKSIQFNHAK